MPYVIKKVKGGFKTCKKSNTSMCYSNRPLTKKMAMKQRTAINLSEMGMTKPMMKGKGRMVLVSSDNTTPNAPISKPQMRGRGIGVYAVSSEFGRVKF
jgi:hypothetical protein